MNSTDEEQQLIYFDKQTHKLELNESALKYMSAITGPIGLVSSLGPAQSGKSFLLNKILMTKTSGFLINQSASNGAEQSNRLSIWPKTVKSKNDEGENIHILLMDTNLSFNNAGFPKLYSEKLLCFTMMVSSCIIYNKRQKIETADIAVFKKLFLMINNFKKEYEADRIGIKGYLPYFLLLLRDWTSESDISQGFPTDYDFAEVLAESSLASEKETLEAFLKSFPKNDIQCLTTPLLAEGSRGQLENMDLNQLNPDFVIKIMKLRTRILQKSHSKKIESNSASFTGESMVQMMKMVVNKLNQCSNESDVFTICFGDIMKKFGEKKNNKGSNEAIKIYEASMEQHIESKQYLNRQTFMDIHKRAKILAFDAFEQNISKGSGPTSRIEFKELIREKSREYKQVFERKAQLACQSLLDKEKVRLLKEISTSKLGNFQSLEIALTDVEKMYELKAPDFDGKKDLYCIFQKELYSEGFRHLMEKELSSRSQSLNSSRAASNENLEKLKEVIQERDSLLSKLETLGSQNRELCMAQRKNENMVNILREELDCERRLSSSASRDSITDELTLELQQKLKALEEQLSEKDRQLRIMQAEAKKEMTVQSKKIEYLETALEESSEKERKTSNELKKIKKEHFVEINDSVLKYETSVKTLELKNKEILQRILELENEVSNSENLLTDERRKWGINENHYKNQLEEGKETLKNLLRELQEAKASYERQNDSKKEESTKLIQEMKQKIIDLERLSQSKEKQAKETKLAHEKDCAVLNQKIEFLELQLAESKSGEAKSMEEAFLKAIEINEDISFLKSPKSEQVVENRFSNEGEGKLKQEIKRLDSENRELKNAILNLNQKLEKEREKIAKQNEGMSYDFKSEMEILKRERLNLEDKVKILESEKSSQSKDLEEVWKKKIMQSEMRLAEKNEIFVREKEEIQKRCEETITHLKAMFESDKEKYLEKLLESKDKHKKEIQEVCEEFEKKLLEDRNTSDEIIKQLKNEVEDKNREFDRRAEEGCMSRNRTCEDDDEIARRKIYEENEAILMKKIDELASTATEKENEIARAKRKNKKLREKNSLLSEKVNDLLIRLEKLSKDLEGIRSEHYEELSLKNQELESLHHRLNMTVEQTGIFNKHCENQLKEHEKEAKRNLSKVGEDSQRYRDKYKRAKKRLFESEQIHSKQMGTLENERQLLRERLELQTADLKKYKKKIQKLNRLYQAAINKDSRGSTEGTLEKAQMTIEEMDSHMNEVTAAYEKERQQLENRIRWLEEQSSYQRNDSEGNIPRRSDLNTSQINNTSSIGNFNPATALSTIWYNSNNGNNMNGNANNNSFLNMRSTRAALETSQDFEISPYLCNLLERKAAKRVKDLTESFEKKLDEIKEKLLKKEAAYNELEVKFIEQKEENNKMKKVLEKRLSDFAEKERYLQGELDNLKRENKANRLDRSIDLEKEMLKNKVFELEQKCKEAETRRSMQRLEHEREKTRWVGEKENLLLSPKGSDSLGLSFRESKNYFKWEQKMNRKSVNLPNNSFGGTNPNMSTCMSSMNAGKFSNSIMVDLTQKNDILFTPKESSKVVSAVPSQSQKFKKQSVELRASNPRSGVRSIFSDRTNLCNEFNKSVSYCSSTVADEDWFDGKI